MTIEAKIIEDSISPENDRITTLELTYPRIIHSEFMTHRDFSRSASSSRAIPINSQIREVLNNPAGPVVFGVNQRGMQAGGDMKGVRLWVVKSLWYGLRYPAIAVAKAMVIAGLHKQIGNRILEPWSHIHVVVTATRWNNFFALRDHPDADPTIRALAIKMKKAINESKPVARKEHLPYVLPEHKKHSARFLLSTAGCARVSYNNHSGASRLVSKDIELYQKLMGNNIKHASPAEHSASWAESNAECSGNFHGRWNQFRKGVYGEYVK